MKGQWTESVHDTGGTNGVCCGARVMGVASADLIPEGVGDRVVLSAIIMSSRALAGCLRKWRDRGCS